MYRSFVLVLVSILSIGSAAAAGKTREVKMNVGESIVLLDALKNKLEGYDKLVREGDRERVVRVQLQLDVGVRMAIAKNIVALNYAADAYQRAVNAARNEISSDGQIKAGSVEEWKLTLKNNDILSQPQTFNLYVLTETELKLPDNPLPPSVLAALVPIIAAE